jgi:hypothetical protein
LYKEVVIANILSSCFRSNYEKPKKTGITIVVVRIDPGSSQIRKRDANHSSATLWKDFLPL